MRPAISVILLTTLIGAAQGLFLALFTTQSYAAFNLLPPPPDPHAFYGRGSLLALVLLVGGLAASFFHLGHPERAWRAAAKWRTSWLSREVIVLPVFMGVVLLYGLVHWLGWHPVLATLPGGLPVEPSAILGIAGTVLAFALFTCTAMIYACLKFLGEWHSPLTVINFVLLGGASGFSLAAAFAAVTAPTLVGFLAGWAAIISLLALITRVASLYRNARLKPLSTPQTAIGIKHPQIVQRAVGFMGGSFNTREFFHGQPATVLRSVRWFFVLAVFPLPILLLLAGMQGAGNVLAVAFAVQYAGLLGERWYFFAEANHAQNLYYRCLA
jgi:DMSO reductase anchor subunit